MNYLPKVMILISFFLLSFASNLNSADAESFYGPSSQVLVVTSSDFKDKVVNSNSVVLVEFYTPWCGACKVFTPIWEEAAAALKGVATLAAINIDENKDIGQEYGIAFLPTVKAFVPGKPPVDYTGATNQVKQIEEFAHQQVKLSQESQPSQEPQPSQESEPSLSVELTSSNFDEMVVKSKDIWMVEFFAPWCGYCKKLAPEWQKAAKNLEGKVKLGQVNCDNEKDLKSRFKVPGYPTIMLFGANKDSPTPVEGARTAPTLEAFALAQLESSGASPEEKTEL